MASKIQIIVEATAAKARAELDSVATTGQKVGAGFKKMALPAVAALAGLGAAAVKAAGAAAEDDAAQSKLAQTLKTAAGASKEQVAATESWITAQGKALGIADDELRPALGKLAVATGDVGKAQKLAALAMNVSAGSGKSLDQVTEALVKAQNGSLGGLSRLGVATKDAAGKTLSLKAVTKDLADTYTGAAATAADTTAGKQKKLQVQLGELQEQIGAKLLPVLTKMSEYGLKAVEWIGQNEGVVIAFVAIVAGLAATVLVVNAAMAVWAALTTIQTVATTVMTAAQTALNVVMSLNPIALVVIAIAALVAIFIVAYQNSETFRAVIDKSWQAIKAATVAVFDFLREKISAVFEFLKNLFLNFTGPGLIIKHWDTIKEKTAAAFEAVKGFISDKLSAARELIGNIAGGARDKIVAAWDAIKEKTAAAFEAVNTFISEKLSAARELIGNIAGGARDRIVAAWDAVKTVTSAAWDRVKEIIGEKISAFMDKVTGIQNRVTNALSGAGNWLYNAGKDIIQGLINGIDSMIQTVKDKLKALTDLIPKIKGPPARDKKLLTKNGQLIIGSLVDGFERQMPAVRRSLEGLTRNISGFDASVGGTLTLDTCSALAGVAAVGAGSPVTYQINLTVPVGASSADIGRTLVKHIEAFEGAGGRRRA